MRPSTIRNILFFVGLCVLAQVAWGHGGVSSTGERCMLYVYKPGTPVGQITQSQLKANFTGYQPERRASQNFCDDVPYLGKALFVIDFLSPELREMSVDFRILEDRNNAQWDTTYESLGGREAIEQATIYHTESAEHKRGMIQAQYAFDEKDVYIGLVEARDTNTGQLYVSVFPFGVGVTPASSLLFPWGVLAAIVVLAGGGIVGWTLMSRRS